MPFAVLVIEAIVYSTGLASGFAAWFMMRHLPSSVAAGKRLRAWLAFMLATFGIVVVFFVQQTVYLIEPDPALIASRIGFEIAAEAAFVLLILLSLWLYCRFLSVATGQGGLSRSVATVAFAAIAVVYGASLVAGLPGAAERLLEGVAAGWIEVAVLGGMLATLAFHLASMRRETPPAVVLARRLMAVMLPVSLAAEVAVYLVPEETWNALPLSRYMLETTLLYVVYLGLCHVYVARELREAAAVDDGRAGVASRPLAGADVAARADGASLDLSAREREVLECLLAGKSNREIAQTLFISLSTVKTHLHHILEKTGQPSRTALVASLARRPADSTASGKSLTLDSPSQGVEGGRP